MSNDEPNFSREAAARPADSSYSPLPSEERAGSEEGLGVRGFGTIGIVGVGLMGGSIGLALKAGTSDSPIIAGRGATRLLGIGRSVDKLEAAVRLNAIDAYETDLAAGVAQCDLVVLCTTISHIVDNLPAVLETAKPDAVVTDIGSTKSTIVEAAHGDPRFIGGHPMCGSEKTGVEAARANLYHRATWALTPASTTSAHSTAVLTSLIDAVGALPLVLDPVVHDAMVALTSHLPHVMASALMRQADTLRRDLPDLPRMSAGSFADATRVAASHPAIWRDVCLTNRDAVLKALADYRRELSILEEAVASSDAPAIEAFFASGETAKKSWPPRS